MSDLSSVLRTAVGAANKITHSLQANVVHTPFQKYNRSGEPEYDDARSVTRSCVIEKKQQLKRAPDGTERMSHTRLTFVQPLKIGLLDRIVLPDRSTSPILTLESPLDSSGNELITEVWF